MVVAIFICPMICFFLARHKRMNSFIAFLVGFLIFPTIYYAFAKPKGRIVDIHTNNTESPFRLCDNCKEVYLILFDYCPECNSCKKDSTKMSYGMVKDIFKKEIEG